MAERRRFPRIKRRFLVDFEDGGRTRSGFTHNLSPTGIFVCSIHLPKPGTVVKMKVGLPENRNIGVRASVVRSYEVPARLRRFVPSGFCVRLLDPPEEYFHVLAKLFHVAA